MRVSEIIGAKRLDVNLKAKWVRLNDTKNGTHRLVPLDQLAVKLWTLAMMMHPRDPKIFSVVEPSRYSLWYSVRAEAGLGNADLHFHDSRHEAASQIAKRMELLPLYKMFGWTDTKHAMIYYNPTIEEMVHQVDAGKNLKKGHKTLIEMQAIVIKG
jgi:integrase